MTDTVTTDQHADHHPGPGEYVKIALILAVVTAIEVALFYVEGLPDVVLVVALMVFMLIKFALVALWFMHLRFDSPLFRHFFVTGIILSIIIYAIVLFTFGVLIGG